MVCTLVTVFTIILWVAVIIYCVKGDNNDDETYY